MISSCYDFDVVCVNGKGIVFDNGAPYSARYFNVLTSVRLNFRGFRITATVYYVIP